MTEARRFTYLHALEAIGTAGGVPASRTTGHGASPSVLSVCVLSVCVLSVCFLSVRGGRFAGSNAGDQQCADARTTVDDFVAFVGPLDAAMRTGPASSGGTQKGSGVDYGDLADEIKLLYERLAI